MKFNDDITADIASTVKDVLEGKAVSKKEEVKYPQTMYHPESKEEVEVKNKAEAKDYASKGYVVKEVEEPRAKGEKDFKDKHVVKKSGEKEDGTVMKEEVDDEEEEESEPSPESSGVTEAASPEEKAQLALKHAKEKEQLQKKQATEKERLAGNESVETDEESEKQKKYKAFFNKALKKFGVKSPAELKGDKKKEFFNYVDKNYDAGEGESD